MNATSKYRRIIVHCYIATSPHLSAGASEASGTTVSTTYSNPRDLTRWFKNVGADIVTLQGYIGTRDAGHDDS